ncbi:MAG: Ig-like domain-containing protein, partial [Rhodospirillaceae bacterium]
MADETNTPDGVPPEDGTLFGGQDDQLPGNEVVVDEDEDAEIQFDLDTVLSDVEDQRMPDDEEEDNGGPPPASELDDPLFMSTVHQGDAVRIDIAEGGTVQEGGTIEEEGFIPSVEVDPIDNPDLELDDPEVRRDPIENALPPTDNPPAIQPAVDDPFFEFEFPEAPDPEGADPGDPEAEAPAPAAPAPAEPEAAEAPVVEEVTELEITDEELAAVQEQTANPTPEAPAVTTPTDPTPTQTPPAENLVPTAQADVDFQSIGEGILEGNVLSGLVSAGPGGTGQADFGGDGTLTVVGATIAGQAVTIGQPFITPRGATFTLNSDGTYTYERDPNDTSTDPEVFEYTIEDADGDQASTTLTIGFEEPPAEPPQPENLVPQALTDTDFVNLTENEVSGNVIDGLVSAGTGGAGQQDTGGDGALTLVGASQNGVPITLGQPFITENGSTLILNGDGSYTYTPAPGLDRNTAPPEDFDYTISDVDGDTSSAQLIIDYEEPGYNADPPNLDLQTDGGFED